MPKLTIDGFEIEVPKGTKVISAAERLGIMIPRFCFHPALGPVGACRVCAVKFVDGPVKGIQMSCMTDAADGMVVSTLDADAVDFRKHVIEWLMANHPHDCPVCDEGGECLLQDMTVSGGHGIRRYQGKKRTYRNQYLGPFVYHEMNRCIQCWRCRRFYQEFAGYRDLGAMQIAYRTYFGRFTDGRLESPFAGNLNDICPTGVYTDKPSRYRGRRWDFQRNPSLCIHCSLGCNVVASAHYREIIRIEARLNDEVNGYFICDRGRYGFAYESHSERPRQARVDGNEVALDEAIRVAGERLSATGGQVAFLASERSCLESQATLKRLCQLQRWQEPIYFYETSAAQRTKAAVSALSQDLSVSMQEIEKADLIIVIGADPVNEAPMLTLAMRQASRREGNIFVIDPRPIVLPFSFDHFPAHPEEVDVSFAALIKGAVDRNSVEKLGPDALRFYDAIPERPPSGDLLGDRFLAIQEALRKSQFPVIVCGTQIVGSHTPSLAGDLASCLRPSKKKVGLFYILGRANSFGAGLLSGKKGSLTEILPQIEEGKIKALVIVEGDPFASFPDSQRLEQALKKLDLLIGIDYLPSRTSREAQIFLPSSTLFEQGEAFINQEGRVQWSGPTYPGGISMAQISGGDHPPRVFRSTIPGNNLRPAWKILDGISAAIGGPESKEISGEDLWDWLRQQGPAFEGFSKGRDFGEYSRVALGQRDCPFSLEWMSGKKTRSEDSLELLWVDWTFGTEELSSFSKISHLGEKTPAVLMHPREAERLNLHEGDRLSLSFEGGPLELELRLEEKMATKIMVLPRHRQLEWQKAKGADHLEIERIRKA